MSKKLQLALSVLAGVALAGSGAGAAAASPAAAAAGTCNFTRTVCLWDQPSFAGSQFNVQASNPSTGTCINLASHGWGSGRTKSARNNGTQVARLYTSSSCTGTPYQLIPQGGYGTITFDSNSIYVY